jgi:hypothetical protein
VSTQVHHLLRGESVGGELRDEVMAERVDRGLAKAGNRLTERRLAEQLVVLLGLKRLRLGTRGGLGTLLIPLAVGHQDNVEVGGVWNMDERPEVLDRTIRTSSRANQPMVAKAIGSTCVSGARSKTYRGLEPRPASSPVRRPTKIREDGCGFVTAAGTAPPAGSLA